MATMIVGIADLKIGRETDMITTLGLGSCVGITLHDPIRKIGGLVHIMLPEYNGQMDHNRYKFADSGIPDLLEKLIRAGASRSSLVAKLAGGAHMFTGAGAQNFLKIGERNVAVSISTLHALKLPIIANDTGGTHGRTIELYNDTGKLKIRTVGFGEKFI
ncbi:MAG: chemotaxis protein CheD [Clostridiales bacterium]|nr:chemotaxis protein CheD [Clostridiales bacterium]